MFIAGAEAVTTRGTVIVGPLQAQRPEHAWELFAPASGKMRLAATTARNPGTHFIRRVGIEPLFDGPGRQSQDLLPNGEFQGPRSSSSTAWRPSRLSIS
jgi:hypothetical protein